MRFHCILIYRKTARSCGYVSTSTQPRHISGRAHDSCDYAQATSLAVDEHPRRTSLMLGPTLRLR